jgi:tetratricopeptide (TPR) repeat protein
MDNDIERVTMSAAEELKRILGKKTFIGLPSNNALNLLGQGIDLATDTKDSSAMESIIKLGEELLSQAWPPKHQALLHYFLSNGWAELRSLRRTKPEEHWSWQQLESDKQILHLRKAIAHPGFKDVEQVYRGRALTNLGNALSQIGRFVEAIEIYDAALKAHPGFGMALGNKGMALYRYASVHYDKGHQCILLSHAVELLERALKGPLEGNAPEGFKKQLEYAARCVRDPKRHVERSLGPYSLGRGAKEIKYRTWCLRQKLFLNPLNDLGPLKIAGHDPLSLPTLTTPVDTGPKYQGLFNQLKQEFVAARLMFHEGLSSTQVSFADRSTNLIDTLDYSLYGIGIEKTKMSLRMSYSLLDKTAYFINDYFDFKIPAAKVAFSSIWYRNGKYKDGLLPEFQSRTNWPLRGLYSLSRDFFDSSIGVDEGVEPDAKEIKDLRRALEHRYVKVQMFEPRENPGDDHMFDSLAHKISRERLDTLALRALRCSRAAIIYLSFGVGSQEEEKKKIASKGGSMPIALPIYDDRFKT